MVTGGTEHLMDMLEEAGRGQDPPRLSSPIISNFWRWDLDHLSTVTSVEFLDGIRAR